MHGRGAAYLAFAGEAPDPFAARGIDRVQATVGRTDVEHAVGQHRAGRDVVVVEDERVRQDAGDAAVVEFVAPGLLAAVAVQPVAPCRPRTV
nr:hypothetical protein [Albitalea sp.]